MKLLCISTYGQNLSVLIENRPYFPEKSRPIRGQWKTPRILQRDIFPRVAPRQGARITRGTLAYLDVVPVGHIPDPLLKVFPLAKPHMDEAVVHISFPWRIRINGALDIHTDDMLRIVLLPGTILGEEVLIPQGFAI